MRTGQRLVRGAAMSAEGERHPILCETFLRRDRWKSGKGGRESWSGGVGSGAGGMASAFSQIHFGQDTAAFTFAIPVFFNLCSARTRNMTITHVHI